MTTAVENAGEASNDYLGMSDEDFLKINSPGAPASEATVESGTDQQATADSAAVVEDTDTADKTVVAAEEVEDAGTVVADGDKPAAVADPAVVAGADKAKPVAEATTQEAVKTDPAGSKTAADAATDPDKADKTEAQPVNYEAFFKQIMTPFKANGRTIELKTPEEAIRLMQMGAGYGRKIQDMQPHLKVLRMLEKNDLLDEGRLSFLIDINQKNPDAIKKIIKDSGMDPLDLNIEDNVSYNPKNHAVSDQEMTFHDALKEVETHPKGNETLQLINQTWDQTSKSLLWDEPQLLGVIQSQRDTGIYDQIVAEIDRQKLLGRLPHNTPFLHAYKQVGDYMQANQAFKVTEGQAPQIQTQSGDTPQPQVIATRSAAPKAQVQNGDKAAAAAQTKTASTRKASTTVNPLAMADDDFLKQFNGRL